MNQGHSVLQLLEQLRVNVRPRELEAEESEAEDPGHDGSEDLVPRLPNLPLKTIELVAEEIVHEELAL